MATLTDFISRVVPWPGEGQPGVVNHHWRAFNSTSGNHYWGGRPHNSVASFVSLTGWAVGRPQFIQDIYFCLSLQSQTGKYSKGKPTVARSADNAVALKAIWLDIDVKDPPKGYATREEALQALDVFLKAAELPFPTSIVASGGGLHVYWINNKALTVEEWRPYAEGLKEAAVRFGLRCDAGLTTDCARILRVPETFNYKTDPPRRVDILWLDSNDLDFATALQKFELAGRTLVTATVKPSAPKAFDLSAFAGKKPVFDVGEDHLSDGLKREDNPLDPRPIIAGCPFFKDAFKTHGKDHGQPLWNLAVLASTFMEKGDVIAHEISNHHPGYTAAETDAMFARKLREREQKGLGWPSCKAIENEGCKLCKGCPHFGQIKSPLNLALQGGATPPSSILSPLAVAAAQPPNLMLPKGYAVDPKTGIICLVAELPIDRGPPIMQLVPLFKCVLSDPWIQAGNRALNFKTTLDKGRIEVVCIPDERMATLTMLNNELFKQGVLLNTQVETKVREFIVSWKAEIQNRVEAQQTVPFGWVINPDGGKVKGFAYGGNIMHRHEKGVAVPNTPSGYGDPKIRKMYAPQGSIEPWYAALKMITDQDRPDLELIIATAFAGPLMEFVGKEMITFSAHGESGAHKSSAMRVAMSMWGHPKLTQDVHTSTTKQVLKRLGQIVNIPVFWDELSTNKTIDKVFDTMFSGGQGVEGGTLNSNRDANDRGMWRTSMSINLNESFIDYVAKKQRSTEAGVYRVFEYWVNKKEGQYTDAVASNLLQKLEYNYGAMGLAYSQLLAAEPDDLRDAIMKHQDTWAKQVQASGAERNWVAACTVAHYGALLANTILPADAQLHTKEMQGVLHDAYMKMRHTLNMAGNAAGSFVSVRDILLGWFNSTEENTIWTRAINMGRGKPKAIDVIHGPNPNRQVPIFSQFGVDNRCLRISRTEFTKWLHSQNYSPSVTFRGLVNNFGMSETEAYLASGTRHAKTQERLFHFDIPEGSPLEVMLFAKSSADERPKHLREVSSTDPVLLPTGLDAAAAQAEKDLKVVRDAA